MKVQKDELVGMCNFEPALDEIRQCVLQGLSTFPKTLPCKLFYDEAGSRLFDEICLLDEYYPTRTEISIFEASLKEMTDMIGAQAMVVELGSGSGLKTRRLLRHLQQPVAYVPVEISKTQLLSSASELARLFPEIQVLPVCADYTKEFQIPSPDRKPGTTVVFFPGSTIGNFVPEDAEQFLQRMADLADINGGVLIGVDLKKDSHTLERAYNDRAGVTAAFNLNLLRRIAREFEVADFSESFYHDAVYNQEHGRIEMYLVSKRKQVISLGSVKIPFEKDERITTEYSYKYSLEQFNKLALRAGLEVKHVWTDANMWFSVQYLRVNPKRLGVPVYDQALMAPFGAGVHTSIYTAPSGSI